MIKNQKQLNMSKLFTRMLFPLPLMLIIIACGGNSEDVVPVKQLQAEQFNIKDDPAVYELSLQTDSMNTQMRLKLAAVYYMQQKYDKAIFHCKKILSIDPNNMGAVFNLGNIYYDMQQNETAIMYYERYLNYDYNSCNVRCDLATCYMRLNNNQKALELLRTNVEINNKHPQTHHNLSVILNLEGKKAEAEKEMKIYHSLAGIRK
jgi:tetratricopeptide (TPR) repeat protein